VKSTAAGGLPASGRLVVLLVAVAVCAQPALAQSAAPSPAASSAPKPSPTATPGSATTPTPAQPATPTFDGLLGDFGNGARSNLAKRGITVSGHFVSEAAANLTGGIPLGGTAVARGTALASEFGFGFDADFNKLYAGSGFGILHFLLTTRFGSNLSSLAIGNLASVQEIYGDGQTTRVTYLDYEQPFFKERLNLRLGKYNQQNDFIAGSTYWGGNLYCFVQNNNICGTPAGIPINNGVVADGSEGYTYYPSSQWGARLKVNLSKSTYVQAAAIQGNPIVNNPDGGLYFGFNGGTGVELPLEVGVTLRNRAGDLVGNVRVGGYYDTSDVQDFATRARTALTLTPYETNAAGLASNAAALASIPTRYDRGRSGADVQFDHLLEGSSAPGKRGTALFTAFEYSDPQTSLISTMFEVGAVRRGTFRNRDRDTIGAVFATENYNVRLQQLESTLQAEGFTVPNTVQDQVIELNYGIQVTPWFILRPGVQYVINPSGVKPNAGAGVLNPPGNAVVLGLGGYLTF
jgi:porin